MVQTFDKKVWVTLIITAIHITLLAEVYLNVEIRRGHAGACYGVEYYKLLGKKETQNKKNLCQESVI